MFSIQMPKEVSIASSTFPLPLKDKLLKKKKVTFVLPPTTSRTHSNITVTFTPCHDRAKTVLYMQFVYEDSMIVSMKECTFKVFVLG